MLRSRVLPLSRRAIRLLLDCSGIELGSRAYPGAIARTLAMAPQPEWMHKVLEDTCTDKYHIEYDKNGYMLSNHMAHAIIALVRLGADESFVRDFTKQYAMRLEHTTDDDLHGNDLSEPSNLLGKRIRFNDILKHYQAQLQACDNDLGVLVQHKFPPLSAGLYNSAVHGFIHLGYGLAANSPRVVCEGLAYLHHSYIPLGRVDDIMRPELKTLGKGEKEILEVLEEVRTNVELRDAVDAERNDPEKNRKTTRFQNAVGALFDYHYEEVLDYVHSIKFPDFWDPENLNPQQERLLALFAIYTSVMDRVPMVILWIFGNIKQISEWILDCAIMVYVKSRTKNDFFLIHGVTAAWSLCQVLPVLSCGMYSLKTLRVFLSTVLGVYLTQHCPVLDEDIEVSKDFPQLVAETISEMRDEHIYKLVQVCLDRSQENESSKELYMKACHAALTNELVF